MFLPIEGRPMNKVMTLAACTNVGSGLIWSSIHAIVCVHCSQHSMLKYTIYIERLPLSHEMMLLTVLGEVGMMFVFSVLWFSLVP